MCDDAVPERIYCMKVGLIQQANTCDRTDNIKKLKNSIRLCADEGAELVVLQELHNGLYFCQTEDTQMFDLAETIPGFSKRVGRGFSTFPVRAACSGIVS